MQNTILITGGAGFIGSHLCDKLLEQNNQIICIDNLDDNYDPKIKENNIKNCLINKNFKFFKIDIRNFNNLNNLFKENKIDKIIHLAAKTGVRASFDNSELYFDVNINGTRNLLELAVKYNTNNFIFGSSSSVYGINKKIPFSEVDETNSQISPYAKTKKEAESLCREYHNKYGLNIICLRFFTVYGHRGRPDMAAYIFAKLIFEEKPLKIYGNGNSKRDYTYVTDIIEGIISALDKEFGFEIINLGNSHPIELKQFISIFEKSIGKKAKLNQLPMQEGDVPITYADINKAKKLLNYEPKVGIEEGVKNFVRLFKGGI